MGGRGKPATDHPDGSADGEMGRAAEGKKRYAADCLLFEGSNCEASCVRGSLDRHDLLTLQFSRADQRL